MKTEDSLRKVLTGIQW